MSDTSAARSWAFYKFGLIVTGKGEGEFLPRFLRVLTGTGDCTFQVIGRVPQRSPITSTKKKLRMAGTRQGHSE